MNSSLYIGATGMKGLAEGMHVTTNNIANVSTIGFKQQDILFSDVMYQTQASMGNWWNAQTDSKVAIGQVGQGLQVEAVRTKYAQGALQSTNRMTDLAINGKGFFQVTDGDHVFYTRAGDFITDKEGVWRTPAGLALNGFKLEEDGSRGDLGKIQIDPQQNIAAKATSSVNLIMNLAPGEDRTFNEANPFFGLLDAYDASQGKPLSSNAYSTSQAMTVYDAEGDAHTVAAYFDSASVKNADGNRYMEFILAADADYSLDAEGNVVYPEAGSGLLMSGVLQFDSAGQLSNISAFTPTQAGNKDLNTWQSASLSNGNPVFNLDGTEMSINFGLSAANDESTSISAAEIGSDPSRLPGLGDELNRSEFSTTSFASSNLTNSYKQDGFSSGVLSNVTVSSDGIVTGHFSNGQSLDLFEIPVCRFTSEDGLRREGSNLFSATQESGMMEMGRAGTENFGEVLAYNIEGSNVDMAQEMVNMIINQRGFQSNSKVVTTADQLLQRAMELKRT